MRGWLRCGVIGALLLPSAVGIACVSAGYSRQAAIELETGTLEERVSIAQAFVSAERQQALLMEVRRHFPALGPDELSAVFLKWEQAKANGGRDKISVIIGIRYRKRSAASDEVMSLCQSLVRHDLRQLTERFQAGRAKSL